MSKKKHSLILITILLSGFITFTNFCWGQTQQLVPKCKAESSEGCRGFLLEASDQFTFASYLKAIKNRLNKESQKEVNQKLKEYLAMAEDVHEAMKTKNYPVAFEVLNNMASSMKDWSSMNQNSIYQITYALFKIMSGGERTSIYSHLSSDRVVIDRQLLSFMHVIYATANRWHVYSVPDMSRAIPKNFINAQSTRKQEGERAHIDTSFSLMPTENPAFPKAIIATLLLDTFTDRAIHSDCALASLSSAQKLTEYVPELLQGQVIELGAGFGMRAGTLAMAGVDIIASDIISEPSRNYPVGVHMLNANNAVEVYPEARVYLAEQPGWTIGKLDSDNYRPDDTLWQLLEKRPNDEWTVVLITSTDYHPNIQIPQEFSGRIKVTTKRPMKWKGKEPLPKVIPAPDRMIIHILRHTPPKKMLRQTEL
ncbi:hypothetical protein M3P05_19370 [Sansalvadorimonas sp. 2012CJ34-2]|uniref:Uncharacterized protein n=1 Tax=Parendozoicomonas callyspongiae TaxID=2942213 RepID=A0ABT0PLG3_9GAMM|nr:hypothetical protein [Sansalvadorimonas sp. 2012CJ34-2]MCL6272086.1 hypothetical protein [Sansalvadorimonas sp. 2012CJ34-2]